MSQIGRISGPLLEANLLRLGLVESSNEYLAFHNNSVTDNLIYLDVVQSKIGIRDGSPSDELRIRDDFKTTSFIVETLLTVDEIEIRNNNSITSLFQPLAFAASSYIFSENIRTNSINIDDNVISTVLSNSDIELRPNGSGTLEVHSDFNITGEIEDIDYESDYLDRVFVTMTDGKEHIIRTWNIIDNDDTVLVDYTLFQH